MAKLHTISEVENTVLMLQAIVAAEKRLVKK